MTAVLQAPGTGVGGSGLPDPWTSDQAHGNVVATVDDPARTALTIEAVAGQTAPLLDLKDENGTDLFATTQATGGYAVQVFGDPSDTNVTSRVRPGAGLVDTNGFAPNGTVWIEYLYSAAAQTADDPSSLQALMGMDASAIAGKHPRVYLNLGASTGANLLVRAWPAQTLSLANFQDEDGNDVARVLASGAIGTSAGEPADADIQPGECFRWFDPTNGAAAAMFKGKSADGTVVTGSVALT